MTRLITLHVCSVVRALDLPLYLFYPLSTSSTSVVRCPYFGEIWSTLLVGESSSSSRGRLLDAHVFVYEIAEDEVRYRYGLMGASTG